MKPQLQPQSAFSLIELSIVLAIIGLVTGAVLAASSYQRTSERATAINEARYYIDAFVKFQGNYGVPPGDMSTASTIWTSAHNGDGNSLIDSTNEAFYVFEHLADAQLISGSYTGLPGSLGASQGVLGTNIPGSSISNVGFYFYYIGNVVSGNVMYYDGFYGNALYMFLQRNANALPDSPFLTPQQAFELDSKFDDGRPATGWMRAMKPAFMNNCTDSAVDASALYNVSLTTVVCAFIFVQQ